MPPMLKRACDLCNIRKIKCDRGNPCARCIAAGFTCTALREHKKSGPRSLRQSKIKILKQQHIQQRDEEYPSHIIELATWPIESSSSASKSQASSPSFSPVPPFDFSFTSDQTFFAEAALPVSPWDINRISLPVLHSVLLLYSERLYGIWPLVQVEDLLFRLETESTDPELYALATALCGATLSYLDGDITICEISPEPLVADLFVAESRRVRGMFDYMEPVGLNTILTSYFLHMHYGRQPLRTQMAAFYVREAITFSHLLGLHNESTYSYPAWSAREQAVMRRLYFLLFMTERYLCIQQGLPTVLESIDVPSMPEGDEKYPEAVKGFLNLVTLFSTPGKSFFCMWANNNSNAGISKDQLVLIQRAIQHPLPESKPSAQTPSDNDDDEQGVALGNPIQLVDIVVSQHWLRSLAWKLSVLRGYVSRSTTSSGALSISYPLEIAVDTLRGIQRFPKHAFEVHGPGMEAKMCEIATALADSIMCSPASDTSGAKYCKDLGAKSVLKGLTDRILETQTMSSSLRDDLVRKVAGLLDVFTIRSPIRANGKIQEEDQYDVDSL